ncbi:conserved oligomeric Golgi complex subunit 2 isoform X3 [Diorhabda sublineata]|uniref:conserved oligomeric Golgi complex subunit 2 isoform X3 n=1 Tax=Diorhabda sublineata TaxID=1163346 RepID=UPI0024E079FE|nr:conserved oligomeric Golgi complex subunit 2 isoform X3 [Diorhabda sublineata]
MSLNEVVSWKESFFKDDFNVDISLSKFTLKSDLETLKRDLKSYGTELQQQMTEILKNETEAIVNLAEYLTNLNAKIEHLSLPFFQLREEIMALLKLIKTAEMSYKMMLYGIKNNNTNKNNLNLKLGAISSSVYIDKMLKSSADSFEDIISLEHIVAKYSFQRSYMDELNIITTDMKDIMPTVALWKAVSQCFHEDIYLDQLADQFVKLSMLTLSRYLKWCETTLQSNFSTHQSTEQFIMNCLIDFSIVEKFMCPAIETPADINNTVYKILDSSVVILVPKIVKANLKSITNVLNLMKSSLVKMKVEEICYQLQHVEAIPRLYRRTNRSIPKEASPYMVEAVKPITTFHSAFQNVISHKSTEILNDIILQVTKQYLELVQGVLRSVCKTEESLRRLKSRNVTTEEISPQLDSGSDEKKIREQIKLDVAYFLNKLQPLGSIESRQIMDVLKKETH